MLLEFQVLHVQGRVEEFKRVLREGTVRKQEMAPFRGVKINDGWNGLILETTSWTKSHSQPLPLQPWPCPQLPKPTSSSGLSLSMPRHPALLTKVPFSGKRLLKYVMAFLRGYSERLKETKLKGSFRRPNTAWCMISPWGLMWVGVKQTAGFLEGGHWVAQSTCKPDQKMAWGSIWDSLTVLSHRWASKALRIKGSRQLGNHRDSSVPSGWPSSNPSLPSHFCLGAAQSLFGLKIPLLPLFFSSLSSWVALPFYLKFCSQSDPMGAGGSDRGRKAKNEDESGADEELLHIIGRCRSPAEKEANNMDRQFTEGISFLQLS